MPIAFVTGAAGFVGRHVCARFLEDGWTVRGLSRRSHSIAEMAEGTEPVIGDLCQHGWMEEALGDADVVVHLGARVHEPGETGWEMLERYRIANVYPTAALVRAAVRGGVTRFVLASTVRVHGHHPAGICRATDVIAPPDPYALSKYEAETALRECAGDMAWVIVRPTFVYGHGARGNFGRLLTLARFAGAIPLPIGSLHGRRSIMHVDNLADLIVACATRPSAIGQTLLAADDPPVSTAEFIDLLARARGGRARFFPFPPSLLALGAAMLGRRLDYSRLADAYVVDTEPLQRVLGWTSPVSLPVAVRRAVDGAFSTDS